MMGHYFSFMHNNKNMIGKHKQILLKMMKFWSLVIGRGRGKEGTEETQCEWELNQKS